MPRRPDFVIIGAMKCATSTLRAQLSRQPGLHVPRIEPNYFSNDNIYVRGIRWYESLFDGADSTQLCGESSTHYTKLPTYPYTVERMLEYIPGARLIYVMRHPVDRLISQYIHEWSERRITVPIEQAIDQHPNLIDYSRYAMQLEPFVSAYGSDKVMPVFLERLGSQPQQELERICRFFGYQGRVRWHEESPQNISSERMRKSPLRNSIIEFPPLAMLRRALVPKPIRARVRQLWTMRQRPRISANQQKRLVEVFDEDLTRLGRWLGVEISCNNFRDVAIRGPLPQGGTKGNRARLNRLATK